MTLSKRFKKMGIVTLLLLIGMLPVVLAAKHPEVQLTIIDQQKNYVVSVVNHRVMAREGIADNPDGIITMHAATFLKILQAEDKPLTAYYLYKAGDIDVEVKLSYAEALTKGYFKVYKSFKKQHPELGLK